MCPKSDVGQIQKDKYCMILLTWGNLKRQIHRHREQNRGSQGLGEGKGRGCWFSGDRVSVWENEKLLWMDGSDGCTSVNKLNATELDT